MEGSLRSTVVKRTLLVAFAGLLAATGWWFWRLCPPGPEEFHLRGQFGPVIKWPLIPLELVTLPDGRVMSYGTDGNGKQSGETIYDIWNPREGVGANAHLTLPNRTGTDLFCSGLLIVPGAGSVLVVGGDRTVDGKRNWASPDINFFDYKQNALTSAGRTMERPRWYPTVATLPDGDVLVVGGRLDPMHYAPLPELYHPQKGWRKLAAADLDMAYGSDNWSYPRLWVAPNGKVFNITRLGQTFYLDVTGDGHVSMLKTKLLRSHSYLPSLMYAPGKVLSLRLMGVANVVDFTQDGEPKVTRTDWYNPMRFNASATVMADGQVFISGGGLKNNDSGSAILANRVAEIWNPGTGHWLKAAVAKKERLYHSVALLMQDGTVLTGGGGAGGARAENNLDVEIYYPPYLYKKDGSGQMAERPLVTHAPDFIDWAKSFTIHASTDVSRLTLVKLGSATHAQVFDQRFMDLKFMKSGDKVYRVTAPANRNIALPGYYYIFAFNKNGVPSIAKILKLDA